MVLIFNEILSQIIVNFIFYLTAAVQSAILFGGI
jgi:hypothetical protein